MSKVEILNIEGMHCSSCVKLIENQLKDSEGIKSINVNLASEKAKVIFDENKINLEAIIKEINKIGYKASLINKDSENNFKAKKEKELKNIFAKLLIGFATSIPLILFMAYDFTSKIPFERELMPISGIISLFLSIIVIVFVGKNFFSGFVTALKVKTFSMDSLIAIGSGTAFIYSIFELGKFFIETGSIVGLNGMKIPNLYFEVSAFLITFVTLGKYLEIRAKGKTSQAMEKLMGMQSKIARVIRDKKQIDINIDDVKIGDIVIVKPGEKIPIDGIICDGSSNIDESLLTGESMPVDKKIGDKVYGATINKNGYIEFKVSKIGKDTALNQIIKLIEEAQGSKAPIQALADKISSIFVPVIIGVAILTFVVWYFLLGASLNFSLLAFVAVMVIACPCALGLATPTSIIVGTGKAAEYGVLIKNGEQLELMQKVKAVVFDKTGTLTKGKPEVSDFIVKNGDREKILSIIYSIEEKSEHPLADAIVKFCIKNKAKTEKIESFLGLAGMGVEAKISGNSYYIGNRKLMNDKGIKIENDKEIEALEEKGKTVMIISDNKKVLGIIAVADPIKENSKEVVMSLIKKGIEVYMISGDNKRTANAIGKELGIKNILAEVMPGQKASEIKKLQEKGLIVAMVGDGINDAPALTQADVGIVMASGADVAMEVGGIIIISNNLNGVLIAREISKETVDKIKQNMFFALFYNVLGIPIAARIFSFMGIILKPELAGLAMALSSVSVVSNSLTIKLFKTNKINWVSKLAPLVMVVLFLGAFVEFAKFSSKMSGMTDDVNIKTYVQKDENLKNIINNTLLKNTSKIAFIDNVPKFLVGVDFIDEKIKVEKGNANLNDKGSVVLGANEAAMMIDEGLIKGVGSEIKDFLGLEKITIVGILEKTGTIADDYHFLNKNDFESLSNAKEDLVIKESKEKDLKMFYLMNENNIPVQLQEVFKNRQEFYNIDNKKYLGVYIGFSEAKMMKKENLFNKEMDKIIDFFGKDVVIIKVLKRTMTSLDMMHFVEKDYFIN